jgi:predicted RNase H-like HicB family nuclease
MLECRNGYVNLKRNKKNCTMDIHEGLTAIFEKHGNDYIGYIEEIPGVNTQGATLDEARTNLQEALELTIKVRREISTI